MERFSLVSSDGIVVVQGERHNVYPTGRLFLVNITSEEYAQHLINTLKEKYEITMDWDAKLYIVITLKWWYNLIKVQLSMPTYVPDAINKIKRIFSGKPQDAPAAHITPKFGKIIQYSEPEDIKEALQQDEIARIQMIVWMFLYYSLAIDNTTLPALGDIASEKSKSTNNKDAKVIQFLN